MHPQPCSCPDLKPPRFQRKRILRRCSSSPTSCPSCSITGAVPPRAQPQRRRQQSTRKQPAPEGTRAKSPGPAPARYLGIEQKRTVRVDMGRSGQGRESKPTSERGHVREASCGPDHGAVLLYTSSAHRTCAGDERRPRTSAGLVLPLQTPVPATQLPTVNPGRGGGEMCPTCGARC